MALHVLAYNMTRVINIMGVRALLGALRGYPLPTRRRHSLWPGIFVSFDTTKTLSGHPAQRMRRASDWKVASQGRRSVG